MLWTFKPNWAQGINETLEWYTSVLRTRNGSEQRRMLRAYPRRRFRFQFALKQSESQKLDNFLLKYQPELIYVPAWMYRTITTAPTSTNVIPCDTTNKSYVVGQRVLVGTEVAIIQSVLSTQLTTESNLATVWPTGTEVFPVYYGAIEGNVPLSRQTDHHIVGSVQHLIEPTTGDAYLPDADAPETVAGFEFLRTQPDWKGGIDFSQDFPSETIDAQTGAIERAATSDLPEIIRPFRFMLKTLADIKAFREFLGRRKGRLKPFLMPTWFSDLKVISTISSSDTQMVCENNMHTDIGDTSERGYVFIRIAHTTYIREVTNVQASGDNVVISFTPSLGGTYTPNQILAVNFINLYRLASDQVTIQWLTDSIATVDLNVVNVKFEY